MKKVPKIPRKKYVNGTPPNGIQETDELGNPIVRDVNGNPITSGTNMLNAGGTEFKTTGDYTSPAKEDVSDVPADTTTPATDTSKKGGKGFNMGNMAWLQYANMAQGAVRKGNEKNLETVTDPKTGKTYTKYKNDNAIFTESFAEPTHEKVMNKAKEGDWKGVAGQVFGGHFYDLYDKNKQQKEFSRIEGGQNAQEALEARESGQTMVTTQSSDPMRKQKWNAKLGTKIFEAGGYKSGGEIKGKGTGTSDSINAELEEGGFVVPAENNFVAKAIRKNVLKDNPKKKATLHKGDVPVKVSNGEHFFTEEEKEEMMEEMGEGILKMLAPDAEENDEMNKGGELDPEKAKKILHDKMINGQPLTDRQRRFMGWVAGGRKMATGGEVEDGIIPEKDVEKAFKANEAKDVAKKQKLIEEANKIEANLKAGKPSKYGKGYDESILKSMKEQIGSINKKYNITDAPETKPATKSGAELMGAKKPVVKPTLKVNPFVAQETIPSIKPNVSLAEAETQDALREVNNVNSNAVDTNPISSKPSETKEVSSAGNFWDKVNNVNTGNLLNTGLGVFQVGMGLKGLKDKRPVQELDKTFNANVDKAQAQAQYGFTPEQRFLVDQQNQNALNQEIFAAKNFAGGSASNAYNMTRSALNNAFMRNLQTKATDTGLQQDKQAMANNLALQRANMSRAIFEDSLSAFNTKQRAAGSTLGAGISNLMDANRFNQYMKLRDEEQTFNQNYGF